MADNDNKVQVNQDLCIGCGMCASISPDIFAINHEIGKAEVKDDMENACDQATQAKDMCPVGAISCE